MNNYESKLIELLSVFKKEGILDKVILIGSWCLTFYKKIFTNFDPSFRTTDIDFYVPNAKSIDEKNNLINSLKDINYDVRSDYLTNVSKFISPDGFEVEFLTKLNRKNLDAIKLGNTDIYAESLSYLDIFSGNYVEVNYQGLKVKVASPASYALQKLLINDRRKKKKVKDINSVKEVLAVIKISHKYKNELSTLFNTLPKKWKQKILKTAKDNKINLFD